MYSKELYRKWNKILFLLKQQDAIINGVSASEIIDLLSEIDRLCVENTALKDAVNFHKNYSKECDVEIESLQSQVKELQSQSSWVRYVEGDESTNPNVDGGLYEIIYENKPSTTHGHEYYFFNDGWATEKIIMFYRKVPPIPEVTK